MIKMLLTLMILCLSVLFTPENAAAQRHQPVLIPGENWQELKFDGSVSQHPIVADTDGSVYVGTYHNPHIDDRVLWRISPNGHKAVFTFEIPALRKAFYRLLCCGPENMVYFSCRDTASSLVRCVDRNGKLQKKPVIQLAHGDWFMRCYGGTTFVLRSDDSFADTAKLTRYNENGKPTGSLRLAQSGSLTLGPNHSYLIVQEEKQLTLVPLSNTGLGKPRSICRFDGVHISSIACDTQERIYVPTHSEIKIFNLSGRQTGTIPYPRWKTPEYFFYRQITFGGTKRQYLYLAADRKLYRRKIRAFGVHPATPPLHRRTTS